MAQNILDNLYKLFKTNKDIDLFNYVNDNYDPIIKIMDDACTEHDNKKETEFFYDYKKYKTIEDLNKLTTKIANESLSFITIFRIIILNLINKNADSTIDGKTVMPHETNQKYKIITTNTNDNLAKFASFILVYNLEAYYSEKMYLAIDLEFNNQDIALCQLNFETNTKTNKNSYIFLVNPDYFDVKLSQFFRASILQNKYIFKILHGSDPLDIPYIYDKMFNSDKKDIIKFTRTVIDTRFLCEYTRITEQAEGKCSIYNALLYFGTITEEQFNYLEENNTEMSEIDNKEWNIYELAGKQLIYAIYDVLFLKRLYYDIVGRALKKSKDDAKIFKYIIPELTRFIYLERRGVTDVLATSKLEIDPLNNYMFKSDTKSMNMINVYNAVLEKLVVHNPTIVIKQLMGINYFKGSINIICKKIVYNLLTYSKNTIYKNKKDKYTEKIYTVDLFNYMDTYKFAHIKDLMIEIQKECHILVP